MFQSNRVPLHWAASAGNSDIAEFILKHNIQVDIRDEVRISCHMWEVVDLNPNLV